MSFPYGWTQEALNEAANLAKAFDADSTDILALWFSESGLQPRIGPVSGYYGLIMGREEFVSPSIGTSWIDVVKNRPITVQIAAIKRFWDVVGPQNFGGESFTTRANKLGTTPAAMIYAVNFVPAFARQMKSADQPMVSANGPGQQPKFYHDNPGFDVDKKGYITIRDMDKRIQLMKQRGLSGQKPWSTPEIANLFIMIPKTRKFGFLPFLASAGIGAGIGSFIPGIGTVIGGALGGMFYGISKWLPKVWPSRSPQPSTIPTTLPPKTKVQTLSRPAAISAQSYALQNVTNPVTLIDLAKQLVNAGHGDLAVPLVLKAESRK